MVKMNGVDMRTMLLLEAPLEPQSVCIDIDAHDFIVSVGNLDCGNLCCASTQEMG